MVSSEFVNKADPQLFWHTPKVTAHPFTTAKTGFKHPALVFKKSKGQPGELTPLPCLPHANATQKAMPTCGALLINHSPVSPLLFIKGSIYSPERWPALTSNICILLEAAHCESQRHHKPPRVYRERKCQHLPLGEINSAGALGFCFASQGCHSDVEKEHTARRER